jgi:hypothetical protein
MVRASATELASGFSHSTCLPAASAARAICSWLSPGVQMSMRSMSSRATSSRQSVTDSSQPSRPAAAATAAGSRPATATIRALRGRSNTRFTVLHAWECAVPMNAYPTMPMRSSPLSTMDTCGTPLC